MSLKITGKWQILYKYINKLYIPVFLIDFGSATQIRKSATAATKTLELF